MGQGLNPSFNTHGGSGFSGSPLFFPSSSAFLSAFGALYFQNPDPLKFVGG